MIGCGCGCATAGEGICPCEDVHGPWWPYNPGGLAQLEYRVGDFESFRHELVRHLPGEVALTAWRPGLDGDLGLQVLDWFAIVADVLSFYNERIANEAYLATAQLPESVQRLVGLLGYRPRPGIGAIATLAALAAGPGPVILPDRFAISSKAQPGLDSQTFELTTGTAFASPTSVPTAPPDELTSVPETGGPPPGLPPGAAEPPPHLQLIAHGGVLVKGKPSAVATGDTLLLRAEPWNTEADYARIVTVTGMVPEPDPHGRPNTRLLLSGAGSPDGSAQGYKLQRPTRTNHLITVPSGTTPISKHHIYLDATARWIKAGDPVAVGFPGTGPDIAQVSMYSELMWDANGDASSTPPAKSSSPIPLVVAMLNVAFASAANIATYATEAPAVSVESGWKDVGTLLDTAVTQVSGLAPKLTLARAPVAPAGRPAPALVQDAVGQGALVAATPVPGTSDVALAAPAGAADDGGQLTPPLQLLWDLITVTRGASVRGEHLGTGDATSAGQDFKLSRFPVTYLADGSPGSPGPSRSGEGYSSTIELIVDGLYWTEVPTLFGHGPVERVFSTYEDADGYTHVLTGDGEAGTRLRTGAAVSANYRTGSGAASPPATSLTQVMTPAANLSAVRNPVAAGGGADPDPPARLREYAPRSVLTFGRAVSGDDYEAVAALAPGVTRARAVWAWDAEEQRSVVHVYVGDDDAAVSSARTALSQQADPNRPIVVLAATPIDIDLSLTVRVDPAYVAADVIAAVTGALLDGLFAPGTLGISEVLYRSRLEACCRRPGVLAVHQVSMGRVLPWASLLGAKWFFVPWLARWTGPRFDPGEGCFFRLAADDLDVAAEQP